MTLVSLCLYILCYRKSLSGTEIKIYYLMGYAIVLRDSFCLLITMDPVFAIPPVFNFRYINLRYILWS